MEFTFFCGFYHFFRPSWGLCSRYVLLFVRLGITVLN